MTKKDFASKLAAGIRQAKGQSSPAPENKSAAPSAPAPKFARQANQSPPASLDDPWKNLHPQRIWPD